MKHSLKPLSLVYNVKSGLNANHRDEIYEQLLTIWSSHGFEIQVFDIATEVSVRNLLEKVILRHKNEVNKGVVVIAGGDGTLNSVAKELLYSDIPIGILPLGTFNYVARVLQIPLEILAAAEMIATGRVRTIHVAKINQHIYLNNASLGLYPLFIKKRELYNQKFGRLPLNAYTSGLDVLIRDHKELRLEIEVDGKAYAIHTPLIFFGNNQLQLQEMNLKIAKCAEQGYIAGVILAKSDKTTLFKTLYKLIRGKLEQAADVYSFSGHHVWVKSKTKNLTVAIDGEIVEMETPLKFHIEKNALKIMVPYDPSSV